MNSENPNGIIRDVGVEFRDTTDGGYVKDAGARTVKDRSSGVKFNA